MCGQNNNHRLNRVRRDRPPPRLDGDLVTDHAIGLLLASLYAIAIYTLGLIVGWLITRDHNQIR